MYRVSKQKYDTVDMMKGNAWNFEFSRELDPAKRIDLLEIKFEVRDIRLFPGEEDTLEGVRTSKALYSNITEDGEEWEHHKTVTNKFASPKTMFIVWAAMHDSIPTREMLQNRGMEIVSNLCLLCNNHVETQDHLFLQCEWVKLFWDYFINSLQVKWVSHNNFKLLLQSWSIHVLSKKAKLICHLIPLGICWELWLERNGRVHGRRHKTKDELLFAMKLNIRLWSSNMEIFRGYSMNQVLFQWEDVVM
ncbi:uncharacterized protein LOC113351529 [Papaver somniferum]|uniref:uncharacterized protein LOC113351529 n=1 Tax=Papaver somniferum TaxID=3469 RepID=UPI000E7049C6|nr:uncharacterized protein LOC113351529 [Papaver somniferum]